MARLLLAALPAAGHVGPLLSLAAELHRRGHDVRFYTGEAFRDRVQAVGARHLPMVRARDIDAGRLDEELPGRADHRGLARFRFDMVNLFIAAVPGQVADLEAHVAAVRPDALVVDPALGAAARIVDERHGLPWATQNIGAVSLPSRDTAPFGSGFTPPRGPVGRAASRALGKAMMSVAFRGVRPVYEEMAARMSVEPRPGGLFAEQASPYLFLQPTAPSFEYPRGDLPAQLHFVGAMTPGGRADLFPSDLPTWWPELGDDRPVVLVTQGTIATDVRELLAPALEALRDEPVLVVAVTGGPDPWTLGAPPANARVERFVPFGALLPHVDAVVSNGGYGGLHFALSHGVPLVVSGATEDKPELAARVRWSGVGVGMRAASPSPAKVRAAVRQVLDEPRFAARARALCAELACLGGPRTAAALVEQLVATGRPVHRLAMPEVPERVAVPGEGARWGRRAA